MALTTTETTKKNNKEKKRKKEKETMMAIPSTRPRVIVMTITIDRLN